MAHWYSVLTEVNNIMIEMPLNVAKCLFFRNVLCEKLTGEEKALLMCLFWKVYIPQHLFFPLGRQILNEKTIWRKSAWHCLGKGHNKNAGSFVLVSGCKGLAFGLVDSTKEKLKEMNMAPEEKCSWENLLRIETNWKSFGIRNWK